LPGDAKGNLSTRSDRGSVGVTDAAVYSLEAPYFTQTHSVRALQEKR